MPIPAVIVTTLIGWAVTSLSSVARKALEKSMLDFYRKSLATPNKIDDIAAKVLVTLMQVDVADIKPGPKNVPTEVVDTVVSGMVGMSGGISTMDLPGMQGA